MLAPRTKDIRFTYSWNNLSFTLFSPFSNFGVDLVAQLGFDLACITSKQRQETLTATVDDIDLVERYRMNYFLALLNLSFRALNEFGLYDRWLGSETGSLDGNSHPLP